VTVVSFLCLRHSILTGYMYSCLASLRAYSTEGPSSGFCAQSKRFLKSLDNFHFKGCYLDLYID
jgi:hypothetical protein